MGRLVGWAAAWGRNEGSYFWTATRVGRGWACCCTTAEAIRIVLDTMVGAGGRCGAAMGR
jgi:hypothetical protein